MTNQLPTLHVAPEWTRTLGGAAAEFGASFGIVLDEWQRRVMDDWLALDANGKWASGTCGLSVPRQNGKTALVKVRAMFGIFSLGETILFTAHEVRTSRQVFDGLADVLRTDGQYADLAAAVEYVKRSNGYEEIKVSDWLDDDGEWHKGGKLLFSARSKGAARGFTADLVIADEAMTMTDEHAAALMPTMASAAGGDSQLILLGTPPSPSDGGTVFAATRKSALDGAPGVTWSEWGVDIVGDVHDWARIERCNPSLGVRLMRKAVESELSVMAPDYFARERLGWWSDQSQGANNVIQEPLWRSLTVDSTPDGQADCYGVKYSADGARVAVSVCRKTDAGFFVELVFDESTRNGVQWLVDKMSAAKDRIAMVAVDGKAGAGSLAQKLEAVMPRGAVHLMQTSEVMAANSALLDAARDGKLSHRGQPQLMDSATKTARRKIGNDGGFGFADTEKAAAAPIESTAVAMWAAEHTKRKPGRKQRVI